MMNKMMQAIRYHQFGGADVLQLEQVPRPEPQAGEVLVKVYAAGVLPVDWKIRKGLFPMPVQFPHIPGTALAGVVEEVGSGVTQFQKGQAVFGRTTKGTYAEYTTAPAEAIAHKPLSISFDEAATLSGGATTAWRAIVIDGVVKAGDRVLVHGAAGGVGLFAIQFAKWKGAYVIGTAGPSNVDFIHSLGADTVIDYTTTSFEQAVQDVDLVLDTIGGETLERSWSVVRRGGSLVSIAGQPPLNKAQELGIRVMRSSLATNHDLDHIAKLIDEGIVKTFIEKTFTLSDARQAHEHSQSGHGRGRIVLHIADM
ncbi:NADPH:quinone reductase-like Zn-dependent oxidoreductase [Paenibacillus castaneae]|uniref:NADP-dependent oxidoreductase n=1 Tax=Paenibacillus castaneae TaxID=474957 RepID=UPI001FBB1A33|nr:NADP-dependent oxidoreductase [Paenibacillus castaneae]NIK77091.1 NADPH:quinone reductase-like Zn-dependent oxidoreductase [Paenibacillus castaneae]